MIETASKSDDEEAKKSHLEAKVDLVNSERAEEAEERMPARAEVIKMPEKQESLLREGVRDVLENRDADKDDEAFDVDKYDEDIDGDEDEASLKLFGLDDQRAESTTKLQEPPGYNMKIEDVTLEDRLAKKKREDEMKASLEVVEERSGQEQQLATCDPPCSGLRSCYHLPNLVQPMCSCPPDM